QTFNNLDLQALLDKVANSGIGQSAPSGSLTAVPEPGSLVLAAPALAGLVLAWVARRKSAIGAAIPCVAVLLTTATSPAAAETDTWTGANSQPLIINDAIHWGNAWNWNPPTFISSDPSTVLVFNAAPSGEAYNDYLGTFV